MGDAKHGARFVLTRALTGIRMSMSTASKRSGCCASMSTASRPLKADSCVMSTAPRIFLTILMHRCESSTTNTCGGGPAAASSSLSSWAVPPRVQVGGPDRSDCEHRSATQRRLVLPRALSHKACARDAPGDCPSVGGGGRTSTCSYGARLKLVLRVSVWSRTMDALLLPRDRQDQPTSWLPMMLPLWLRACGGG